MSTRARLRWRCRRGIKELDILLERIAQRHLPLLSETELQSLERLLDEDDPDLLDWLTGRSQPADAELRELVSRLTGPSPSV